MVIAAATLAVAGLGCPGMEPIDIPDPSGQPVSLANDVQPIFSTRCTSCHTAGFPTNTIAGINMVLTEGDSFGALVNQPSSQRPELMLVVPGQPDASLLWLKVSSSNPPVGSRMPLFGSPLSASEQATIRDWIAQGAMNN